MFKDTPCTTCIPGIRSDGVIVHRICTKEDSPHNGKAVRCRDCRVCQGVPVIEKSTMQQVPSLVTRAITYTEAVAEWVAAGRPERSDKEVQAIFKNFCEPCSWRLRQKNICAACGCRVATTGMAIINKIKMATQHCPKEKW